MVVSDFDAIVIGAGIQGSYAAYHLSKTSKALLIDQFALPHSRGSSHGQSRIIRKAYSKACYAHMMTECYQQWKQLEAEGNIELFRSLHVALTMLTGFPAGSSPAFYIGETGLLVLGEEVDPTFQNMKKTLIDNKVPMATLTSADFSKSFPAVKLPKGVSAILDKTAGILQADRALKTVQDLFRRFGGTIRDGEKVVEIQPGYWVTVTTTLGIYRAKSLVITAGPWTNELLNLVGLQLPLKTRRIIVCYWKEKVPGTYGISKGFPCFIRINSGPTLHDFYGLPSNEYPGLVKVCHHDGNNADPDERDINFHLSSQDVNLLSDFLSKEFPGLDPRPAVIEYCMYTNTPDHDFILDHHPDHGNIIIGAGFSGHGFKFAPVVGKVLSELCFGNKPSYDLSPFKINRFWLKSSL